MNALSPSRARYPGLSIILGLAVVLACPVVLFGQTIDVRYYRGKCGATTAPVPAFLCPPASTPVPDTTGPAGVPDGVVDGLDVPCNTSGDCGGVGCFTGVCTSPAAVIGASCNAGLDCAGVGTCATVGMAAVPNDTTLLCWIGGTPAFCADVYHGAIGLGITKGQEADGVCPDGGIPALTSAIAPVFWMLNTNDVGGTYTATGTVNPAFGTCYDPNPDPGPAASPIVASSPPAVYAFPSLIDIPVGAAGDGGVSLTPAEDPNDPVGYAKYYDVGVHDCAVFASNNLGDALPLRCSTPGPNPGPACGSLVGCTSISSQSICLGLNSPITRQAPDYDGSCGQLPGPPPVEDLCP